MVAATACGLTVALTIVFRMVFFKSPFNAVTLSRFFLHLGSGLVGRLIAYVVAWSRNRA